MRVYNDTLSGIINVLKPTGMTSSDAVVKVRNILKVKRAGHLGTLDPIASGVLPIGINYGCKLFNEFLEKNKVYRAYFDFSFETDTLDSAGKITARSNRNVVLDEVIAASKLQIGKINQVPPNYSAKVIDGTRAYTLARNNVEFEIAPKEVEVYDIKFVDTYKSSFIFDIYCSSGTYIRAIVRDMAKSMGVSGYMSALIRTASGSFNIKASYTFDEIEQLREGAVTPLDKALDFYSSLHFDDQAEVKKLCCGLSVDRQLCEGKYLIYCNNIFVGVGECFLGKVKVVNNLVILSGEKYWDKE